MNENSFLGHVETDRDCEQDRLDAAVNRGLQMAVNDKLAVKKLIALAAACIFTFTICIIVNLEPCKIAVTKYYQRQHEKMSGSAEIINDYIIDIAYNIKTHIGGN